LKVDGVELEIDETLPQSRKVSIKSIESYQRFQSTFKPSPFPTFQEQKLELVTGKTPRKSTENSLQLKAYLQNTFLWLFSLSMYYTLHNKVVNEKNELYSRRKLELGLSATGSSIVIKYMFNSCTFRFLLFYGYLSKMFSKGFD
jgi:hypothetical protein